MWAGAQMLLFPSDEESSEKTKKIIVSVIVGLAVIFFAWWIVSFIFKILNNKAALSDTWIPRAVAETQIREIDFTTYSNRIQALKSKLSPYDSEVMRNLSMLVDAAFQHLPDRGDMYINQQYYDTVKQKIADYNLHQESIDLGSLQNALDKFLQQSKTFTIEGQLSAAPRTGVAPLSVTLEAKGMKDGSGTLIPNTNYIWWMRVPEGSKIIGRGKTLNYTFQDEGTYTVNLTVNSASRNNKQLPDVINFEDSVTIEV